MAWDDNGKIYSCGDLCDGKLGHSISKNDELISQIELFPRKIRKLKDKYIIQASCGNKYSCALTNQGVLYAWGK